MQRGLYRHHKGGLYVVIGVVIDTTNDSNGREMVIYTSCVNGKMFARARSEFEEIISVSRPGAFSNDHTQEPRFKLEVPA